MRNLTSALVVVLLLAAASGCKKKPGGGDCAASLDNAMTVSLPEMKKNNVPDDAIPKMKQVSLARCTEDKWSADVLKCLAESKTSADVTGCQDKLDAKQQEAWTKEMSAIDTRGPVPPDGSGSADGSAGSADGSAGSAESGSAAAATGEVPPDCAEYKMLIEKLATCDKMPIASRDALKQGFAAMEKSWANADAKATLGEACKQAVVSVKAAATQTCGW
ncbi:MAG: hypothetical protein H0T89_13880 [Deltaproteobacteria bacterium]|nr:hypothetical protein [Deltaproteobacteria bacterium]MDQ3301080.1 hypothetical protein [Myxococcota bacterium]